jgi:hypothetical protein
LADYVIDTEGDKETTAAQASGVYNHLAALAGHTA